MALTSLLVLHWSKISWNKNAISLLKELNLSGLFKVMYATASFISNKIEDILN
jgi:hypothetical protein